MIWIDSFKLMDIILDNVDEFCQALADYSEPLVIEFELSTNPMSQTIETINISAREEAWQPFLDMIQKLTDIEEIVIGCAFFDVKRTMQLLESLPKTTKLVKVAVKRRTMPSQEMENLFRAIRTCKAEKVAVELDNFRTMMDMAFEHLELFSSFPNVPGEESTVSQLLHQVGNKLADLGILHTTLTSDDCIALVQHLQTSTCKLERIKMDFCEFPDEGGLLVAKAFSQMTSVTTLDLSDSFQDEAFRKELIQSLPSNKFLKTLRV